MSVSEFAIYPEHQTRLDDALHRLRQTSNAKLVFLLDKNGQQLSTVGDLSVDPTSLGSLAAGNVAATDGLAQLIGEPEFSIIFHEGERDHLHINVVGRYAILLVLFNEESSLGLVRLRAKEALVELAEILEEAAARSARGGPDTPVAGPFSELTDDDIEALFGRP